MNIVHQKRELSLIKLRHIDFLLHKYEGQFMAEDIKQENKMLHKARVSELNRLIEKEVNKTKSEERGKITDKLSSVYDEFIKALDEKREGKREGKLEERLATPSST